MTKSYLFGNLLSYKMAYKVGTSAESTMDGNLVKLELLDWLEETVGQRGEFVYGNGWIGAWNLINNGRNVLFLFEKEDHAMLFKLTWGGT